MARAFMEQRQAPLGNTFVNFVPRLDFEDALAQADPSVITESGPMHRRRHSFGGFVPHALLPLQQRPFLDVLESRGQQRKPPPDADGKQRSDGASLEGLVACGERDTKHHASCSSSVWASTLLRCVSSQQRPADVPCDIFPASHTEQSAPSSELHLCVVASERSSAQVRRDCFIELVAAAGGIAFDIEERSEGQASKETILVDGEVALSDSVTTLMIRNLPRRLAQKTLLEELDNTGFAGLFDFCYMPCCFDSGAGKGYAFVNFTTVEAAERLITAWHKTHRFGLKECDVPLNIAPASVQGLIRNTSKWRAPRMSRVRNPNLRPFVVPRDDPLAGESSVSSGGEQVAPAHTIDAETASEQNEVHCTEL
uniref:RRM domain-containing protein n=1 Tax=Noctiluca scintillans TaxID=2966 RepID=A0A7S1AHG0_NOCSC